MKFSFVLALAVVFNVAFTANAQQAKGVEVTPCPNETASRPTLKRRQTNPDNQPVEQQNAAVLNAQPCDNGTFESDSGTVQKAVTIEFEGLTVIGESDVHKVLRERGINGSLGSAVTSESIANAEALIKSLLSDYGHRHAEVSSRFDLNDKGSPVLTFVISEGPFFTISEIRFVGSRVFSEQLLAAKMSECLSRYDEDRPKVYRSEVFEYCIHSLTNFERSQGYLQAKFGEPKIEEIGGRLVITVQGNEGVLYRLGRLEIEGADHVAEQDIRALLDMRTGEIANGEKLSKALYEKLKAVYGEKGFIQYTAEIQPEFHFAPGAAEGVVDFTITIDESRRFRIARISFKGDNLPVDELREMLLLREGDVYNQKLFEQSVNKINETGWFNRVDKDKDVDYRTNEEEKLVDVIIKLSRRDITSSRY